MRLLLAFVISLSCCLAVRARESCDKPVLGRAITRADILQLPRRDTAPPLNLQRALKISETPVEKWKPKQGKERPKMIIHGTIKKLNHDHPHRQILLSR